MKILLKFLIVLWIIIAFFNVAYNAQKSISEAQEWGPLTIDEKRHKIFGDLYDFFVLVDKYTEPDAKIIISSDPGMTLGVGRYYLYPRILIWPQEEKKFNKLVKERNYKYIFSYNRTLKLDGYEKLASFSAKTSKNYAILFKLK